MTDTAIFDLEEKRRVAIRVQHLRETELSMSGANLTPAEYSIAKAAVEQAEQLVARLTAELQTVEAARDAARRQAEIQMEKERALTNVHVVMNRLQMVHAELESRHKAAHETQNAITVLTVEHSALLAALSAAKDRAIALGAT
jgi:hypothetical protein